MGELDYSQYMYAVGNYGSDHWDERLCGFCGGVGLIPVHCCSGTMCGCYGQPVDYSECDACDATPPTTEDLAPYIRTQKTPAEPGS